MKFNSFLKQQQKPATIQNATAGGPGFPEGYKAHLYIYGMGIHAIKCLKGSREKQAHLSLDLVLNIFEGSCFLLQLHHDLDHVLLCPVVFPTFQDPKQTLDQIIPA